MTTYQGIIYSGKYMNSVRKGTLGGENFGRGQDP